MSKVATPYRLIVYRDEDDEHGFRSNVSHLSMTGQVVFSENEGARQDVVVEDMSQAYALSDPRQPPAGFHCGECCCPSSDEVDTEAGAVTFYCSLPPSFTTNPETTPSETKTIYPTLRFSCRGRSVGALLSNEDQVDETDLDQASAYETVDPFLFNPDYTPAGKTGFQVWSGTRLLVECLVWPPSPNPTINNAIEDNRARARSRASENPPSCEHRLAHYRHQLMSGINVLELGSGVGVVGTTLAACGANVLLTDLPTLVENAILPNLLRNKHTGQGRDDCCPSWLQKSEALPIGKGWAAATELDWTKRIDAQLDTDQIDNIDLIVASDCVWLLEMLDALLDTVGAVFSAARGKQRPEPIFLMSFQRRDASGGDDSALFTTVDRVLESVLNRGWQFDCLAWRPVRLDDGEGDKEVFVFEIKAK